MRMIQITLFFVASCIFVCNAGVAGKVETPSDDCSPGQGSEANRRFAYEMYKTAAKLSPNQNVFLAPTTVGSALAMLLPAARERTMEQMWQGLMFKNLSTEFESSDIPCLMKMYSNELVESKMGDRSKDTDKSAMNQAIQLKTANRLFGANDFLFNKEFIKETEKYGAKMSKLDFRTNATASRQLINQWVESVTEGKIKDLFGDDTISSDTVLAVVSAIYFKGLWRYPFKAEYNLKQKFKVSKDKDVEAEYMSISKRFHLEYSEKLRAQVLELPYKDDESGRYNVSMVLILPTEDESIEHTEKMLSEETIKPVLDKFQSPYASRVQLLLPKFKMSLTYKLKPILRKHGIKNLFNKARADLSGMIDPSESTPNLYVSTAVHKTFIEVDEKGTEAAGATGFDIVPLSLPPLFQCSRPFLFMIYEKNTNGVLFIGKVNDPTVEG